MRFTPSPMSTARMPHGQEQIRYVTATAATGDPSSSDSMELPRVQIANAHVIKSGYRFPLEDLPRLFAHIETVREQVSRELLRTDHVADCADHEMWIEIRTRVKAWPAIPGITVPELTEVSL